MKFIELEVTAARALCFEGYRYIEETGFDPDQALTYFFEHGCWDINPTEQMATLFMMQRAFRWVYEY